MLTLEAVQLQLNGFALRAGMTLQPDQRYAVIGPSGAGKSTLLDVIAGFQTPGVGRVLWQGVDLTALLPQQRPVGMLFQDGNLFPHLDLLGNLSLALRPDGGRLSSGQSDQLHTALARVGLGDLARRKPGALSGGQQARGALARVLLQARPILLLDEPFAALGPALKAEMLDLVIEVATGLGALTLMVSHDPNDARRFAPQTILVANGQAHAPQATAALLDNPPPALAAYLGR